VIDRVTELLDQWQAELPEALVDCSELTKRIMLMAAELDEATRRELPEFGLTSAEFGVLSALRRSGPPYRMKPTELTRALLLSSGGTSNVLNHLAAKRLIEREPDPGDGRSTLIHLTKTGVELAERAVRANSAAHARVLAAVPAAAIEKASDALRAVHVAVQRAQRAQPPAARRYRAS
jgi:DNA-binding MarR family transcriptional regulator